MEDEQSFNQKDPNNPVKEYTGVWIPKEVMECEDLTPTEKLAYGEIACFNVCYASNAWLARRLGKNEWTANRCVAKLVELGFVEYCGFKGRFREIRVVKNHQPSEKSPSRVVKNHQAGWGKITNIDKSIDKSIDNIKKERKKEIGYDEIFQSKNVDGELKDAFLEFIKSRNLNKKRLTNHALELSIDKVRKLSNDEQTQIAIINQSIERGWQGLFPISDESGKSLQIIDLRGIK